MEIVFILSLILTLRINALLESNVFIKGGLLFEKTSESLVNLNPPTLVFTRYLNFSTLETAIEKTKEFTKTYKQFCENLNLKVELAATQARENLYFVSNNPVQLSKSDEYCRQRGGRSPEIRNALNKAAVTKFAMDNYVTYIPAGIYPEKQSKQLVRIIPFYS